MSLMFDSKFNLWIISKVFFIFVFFRDVLHEEVLLKAKFGLYTDDMLRILFILGDFCIIVIGELNFGRTFKDEKIIFFIFLLIFNL